MNIKITYNWLLEYLDTDATAQELQKYLSLCGPSIERIEHIGDDYVFDIEITSNRVDMASVFGIAQEAQAILPRFGKKATLKFNPLQKYLFNTITPSQELQADIQLIDKDIATRVSAIILSSVTVGPSPEFMKKRLEMCDIRSINNIVDISNYLMLSLGQPTHTFDYDKIKNHTLHIRKSIKGEKVKTLDEKEFTLPGEDIVIEEGTGTLTDLAGIMGGYDSMVTNNTKNVLLLIETYNKRLIRKTSMTLGQRTMAATYFEKGLDEERIEPTLVYGTELIQKYAHAHIASQIYDIYPRPYKPVTITVNKNDIVRLMGIDITDDLVTSILTGLGFHLQVDNNQWVVSIPSFRGQDIKIKEDIIEEVARVYGYNNLPNTIHPAIAIKQPLEMEQLFIVQEKVKYFLKHLGLHEVLNYSMVSKELLDMLSLSVSKHLVLKNPISEEIKYMRRSLLPSLLKNIKDNEGKGSKFSFFEISKVYLKRENELPNEPYKLGIAINTDFFDLKGIIETLLKELHIDKYTVVPGKNDLLSPTLSASILVNGEILGEFGQLKLSYQDALMIRSSICLAELDLAALIANYRPLPQYQNPNPYAIIKLDLTVEQNKLTYEEMKERSFKASSLLRNIELTSIYQNKLTLRFYFSSEAHNLTEEEAKQELQKIKESII